MTQKLNKLLIVGGGAAGLFAAVTAGELSVPAMVLERRHRPGLKLLITGNNRCNLSHCSPVSELLRAYGEPCADFLKAALEALPPQQLRSWLQRNGLVTVVKRDERVYPFSERADDVLHFFTDRLRELNVPMALNCAVKELECLPDGGFVVMTEGGLFFEAENVLLATGGVSYPKTGSVGDGQRIAAQLGHTVTPLRAGLAGVDISGGWLTYGREDDIADAEVHVLSNGSEVAAVRGNILCDGGILRGSAIFDATRVIARRQLRSFELRVDFAPGLPNARINSAVAARLFPPALYDALRRECRTASDWAALKDCRLDIMGIRPLKEAIVTVGGVSLDEINPQTMESRIHRGLYFAGELMDVDGPTGGYNLQAAFATAKLAVSSVAGVGQGGVRKNDVRSVSAAGRQNAYPPREYPPREYPPREYPPRDSRRGQRSFDSMQSGSPKNWWPRKDKRR